MVPYKDLNDFDVFCVYSAVHYIASDILHAFSLRLLKRYIVTIIMRMQTLRAVIYQGGRTGPLGLNGYFLADQL